MTRVESKQMSMLGAQSEDSKARVQHRPPRRARSVAEQRPGPPPVLCRTHPHIHEHRLQQPERRERTVMVVQTSSVDLDGRTLRVRVGVVGAASFDHPRTATPTA